MNLLKLKIDQFNWYRHKHGMLRLFPLVLQRIINGWLIKTRYLFVADLTNKCFNQSILTDPLKVNVYTSINNIPENDYNQLNATMGPGRSKPFLEHFFRYGARLWISSLGGKIVGLRWTLKGGFSGYFCMPLQQNDVVILAEQVFDFFRGQGFFGRINSIILSKLQEEGISRVYMAVHSRNKSMLKAIKKSKLQMVGMVRTISLPGSHLSIWRKRYLWTENK